MTPLKLGRSSPMPWPGDSHAAALPSCGREVHLPLGASLSTAEVQFLCRFYKYMISKFLFSPPLISFFRKVAYKPRNEDIKLTLLS